MTKNNWKYVTLNHGNGGKEPYRGRERRQENDPTYFGYYALEGIERRRGNGRVYQGVERRKAQDPVHFGYFALEGIERRQAGGIFG
ncbi:MAG: hypothetical protein LJE94_02665 [Deltaproteobacteria bacterium]|nr:hypothetical protein [Deltaproteobacteria bacterium]